MMMRHRFVYRLLMLACLFLSSVYSYKPVILVHGMLSDGHDLTDLKNMIIQSHPATNVTILKYLKNIETLKNLSFQLKLFQHDMNALLNEHPDGVHIICHSQGGLLCLGLIQNTADHRIETFVALSSPNFGQYGLPKVILQDIPILKPFVNLTRQLLSPIIYTPYFQKILSIANYWKDPRKECQRDYEFHVSYLTKVTNDPSSRWFDASEAAQRKRNFLRLKKLVLIGGPDDGVIIPWQSSLFGYYGSDPQSETIIDMKHQKVYLEDWFGLQTLDNRGGLSSYVFKDVHHHAWHENKHVFQTAIEPWLT